MLEDLFNSAGDHAEHFFASWWGFTLYCLCALLCAWGWGWAGLDRWLTVTGTLLVMLLISQSRRSGRAMHIKLDAIDPAPERNQIEALTEHEIEGTREVER